MRLGRELRSWSRVLEGAGGEELVGLWEGSEGGELVKLWPIELLTDEEGAMLLDRSSIWGVWLIVDCSNLMPEDEAAGAEVLDTN
jgi:hypothetical protein